MYRQIDGDYYGFRDEEDGVLERVEMEAEAAMRAEVVGDVGMVRGTHICPCMSGWWGGTCNCPCMCYALGGVLCATQRLFPPPARPSPESNRLHSLTGAG